MRGEQPKLRYVFDVADTGERKNSRPVQLWKMNAEHEQPIIRALDVACLLYTSKDNADTIIGNMDSRIFLGGSEPTTLKELNQALGKETDVYKRQPHKGA